MPSGPIDRHAIDALLYALRPRSALGLLWEHIHDRPRDLNLPALLITVGVFFVQMIPHRELIPLADPEPLILLAFGAFFWSIGRISDAALEEVAPEHRPALFARLRALSPEAEADLRKAIRIQRGRFYRRQAQTIAQWSRHLAAEDSHLQQDGLAR